MPDEKTMLCFIKKLNSLPNISDRIRMLREAKHLTQDEFSELCNLSRSSIARYELGTGIPSRNALIKIADAFQVSVSDILGDGNHTIAKNDTSGNSNNTTEIGVRIHNLRLKKKLTQSELANMAQISQSALSDIENQTKNPSIKTIKKIASALETTVSQLMEEPAPLTTGQMLYTYRMRLQLSQDTVAKDVGISRVALTRYENGSRIPNADILFRLANYLGINIYELMKGSQSIQPIKTGSDDDLSELRAMLRRDPERRILFEAARNVRKKDIMTAVRILNALKDGNEIDSKNP